MVTWYNMILCTVGLPADVSAERPQDQRCPTGLHMGRTSTHYHTKANISPTKNNQKNNRHCNY